MKKNLEDPVSFIWCILVFFGFIGILIMSCGLSAMSYGNTKIHNLGSYGIFLLVVAIVILAIVLIGTIVHGFIQLYTWCKQRQYNELPETYYTDALLVQNEYDSEDDVVDYGSL